MIELLTSAEMGEADRLTIAGGTPGTTLMEAAGRAVADAACVRLQGRSAVVLAGSGNNGGDGFVAGRILREGGHPVRILLAGDQAKLNGDAAEAAQRCGDPFEDAAPRSVDPEALII